MTDLCVVLHMADLCVTDNCQEEKKEEQLYRPATEVCSHLARFLILRTKAWCNDVEFHLETLLPNVVQCHSFQVRADLALLPPHFPIFTSLTSRSVSSYALSVPVHQRASLLGVYSAHSIVTSASLYTLYSEIYAVHAVCTHKPLLTSQIPSCLATDTVVAKQQYQPET